MTTLMHANTGSWVSASGARRGGGEPVDMAAPHHGIENRVVVVPGVRSLKGLRADAK